MKLITALRRLEMEADRRRASTSSSVGLSWSRHEKTVDPCSVGDGEYIAVDIRVEGCPLENGELPAATSPAPCWWAVTERVTRDVQDLGLVRDYRGVVVGRVVELDGSMVTVDLAEPGPRALPRLLVAAELEPGAVVN